MRLDATRVATVLILLLVVPVAVYILDRSAQVVGLSLVSVVLVVASLYLMFGPSDAAGRDERHA